MCWGDVQLLQTTKWSGILRVFGEKLRLEKAKTLRCSIKPKMFSVSGSEKDPVAAYKLYAKKPLTD